MKLYIRFGYLDKFNKLYNSCDFLQDVLKKETGIRWQLKKTNREEIEKLLKGSNINYVIA